MSDRCKYRPHTPDRSGLYVMMFIVLLQVVCLPSEKEIREIVREELEASIAKLTPPPIDESDYPE